MSEKGWVPTDDQVLTEWVESAGTGSTTTRMHAAEAFDRWLAKVRAEAWKAGWGAAKGEQPGELQGAGDLPTPALESASAADFAARWNAMGPAGREAFFQAIRMSDLEWLAWRKSQMAAAAEHEHEMEDACLICGKPWHELGY